MRIHQVLLILLLFRNIPRSSETNAFSLHKERHKRRMVKRHMKDFYYLARDSNKLLAKIISNGRTHAPRKAIRDFT